MYSFSLLAEKFDFCAHLVNTQKVGLLRGDELDSAVHFLKEFKAILSLNIVYL